METLPFELKQRPVRRPRYGGHIERLIGTMMGAVHMLPTTTFSNVEEKGDYPSEKTACLTLGELNGGWLWRSQAFITGPSIPPQASGPHVKSSVTEIQSESDLDYSKLTPFEVEKWQ